MRQYELALILTEKAGGEGAKATKLVNELLTQVKGKVVDTKVMGMRDLAYPIKKQSQGWYGFFMVELDEQKIEELNKILKMKSEVIRHLLVRVDNPPKAR